jgi:hypothetical protein
MPNGKCRVHGGKTPKGILASNFKTGTYSNSLPARIKADYEAIRSDIELLSLHDDAALLKTRIVEVLEQVDQHEAGELWRHLKQAVKQFHKSKNEIEQAEAMLHISFLVNEGYKDYMSWIELRQLLQERVRIVEAERTRLITKTIGSG